MKTLFGQTILVALIAALGLAAMPFVNASAAGNDDQPTQQEHDPNKRLERVWARQLRISERLGRGFERDDAFIERIQDLIDRAEANGQDASAVQTALDAFEAALADAHPIYESAEEIVNTHQGFDEHGKVTDPEQARETIQAMRQKFEEIKAAMNGAGRALHEAIRDFREANPRPRPQTTPTSS
jgi:hypothetical protein